MRFPARRLLLIATRQIGDVLLITPLLRSLRCAYPHAQIDVLVYRDKGGMLLGNPDASRVLEISEHPGWREYVRFLPEIFRRYDLAVSTQGGDRALFFAWLAAPRRVSIVPPGRDGWKRRLCAAYAELDNVSTHTVIQNLRLADAMGIARCYEIVPPRLPPHPNPSPGGRRAFLPSPSGRGVGGEGYAVLHLLPMWRYKRWTIEGWRALARFLHSQGLQVVLTGGKGEAEQVYLREALAGMPENTLNLAGQLNFAEVAELLKNARLYAGPDTAVTHLAAACGAPTLAIYGPTNPLKWSPWPRAWAYDENPFAHKNPFQRNGNVILLQAKGECVPCHQEGCDRHKDSASRCLDTLAAEEVIVAAQVLLDLS